MSDGNYEILAEQTSAALNIVNTVITAWDNKLTRLVDTITDTLTTQAVTLRESEDRITHVNGMIKDLTEVAREMERKGREYVAQRHAECAELRQEVARLNQLVEKLAEDVKHEQSISEISLKQNDRLLEILAGMSQKMPGQTISINEVGNRCEK